MTMPYERTRAVQAAEIFLEELLDPKITPRVPRAIRDRARRILRHYPSSMWVEKIKWADECQTNHLSKR